jgi:hypothetical protein
VYLYRHALELALKDAIIWSEIMISENSTMELRRSIDEVRGELQGHRLRPLYDRLIDRYSLVDSTGESVKPLGLREAIEPAVAAAETLDADGQRLRYPYISRGLEPSWSMERLSPNQTRVAEVSRTIEAALEHLLGVLGAWFADSLERAVEQAWLAQLWEAERRAAKVDSIRIALDPHQRGVADLQGDPAITDDLKSERSADLLLDLDDA